VLELMRIEWHTVGKICERVYKELEQAVPNRFDGLVNIGIDETSYKKGYKYMTMVLTTTQPLLCGVVLAMAKRFSPAFLSCLRRSNEPPFGASVQMGQDGLLLASMNIAPMQSAA
jgi:hypothetical protein